MAVVRLLDSFKPYTGHNMQDYCAICLYYIGYGDNILVMLWIPPPSPGQEVRVPAATLQPGICRPLPDSGWYCQPGLLDPERKRYNARTAHKEIWKRGSLCRGNVITRSLYMYSHIVHLNCLRYKATPSINIKTTLVLWKDSILPLAASNMMQLLLQYLYKMYLCIFLWNVTQQKIDKRKLQCDTV